MSLVIRLLLVDDDEDYRVLTKIVLDKIGEMSFEFEYAGTWEAADEALARGEHDVVLVDHRLGPADGLELIRRWRARGSRAVLILLTGLEGPGVAEKAAAAGADAYLVKGRAGAAEIETAIRSAFDRRAAAPNPAEESEQGSPRLYRGQSPRP